MSDHIHETIVIQQGINTLYNLMDKELSQDWKAFEIVIGDQSFEINASLPNNNEMRDIVIKNLLKDAISIYIDGIWKESYMTTFKTIDQLFNGACKEDHQFEIIREEVVSSLDKDGNPITAKPLNEDNVLVQWQDQNRFPSFDEYARTRLSEEELNEIEKQAQKELNEPV